MKRGLLVLFCCRLIGIYCREGVKFSVSMGKNLL